MLKCLPLHNIQILRCKIARSRPPAIQQDQFIQKRMCLLAVNHDADADNTRANGGQLTGAYTQLIQHRSPFFQPVLGDL